MKFCTRIINKIGEYENVEIVDLDARLKTWTNFYVFYEIWHSEQIEHGNLLNLIPKLKCTPVFMKFGT